MSSDLSLPALLQALSWLQARLLSVFDADMAAYFSLRVLCPSRPTLDYLFADFAKNKRICKLFRLLLDNLSLKWVSDLLIRMKESQRSTERNAWGDHRRARQVFGSEYSFGI